MVLLDFSKIEMLRNGIRKLKNDQIDTGTQSDCPGNLMTINTNLFNNLVNSNNEEKQCAKELLEILTRHRNNSNLEKDLVGVENGQFEALRKVKKEEVLKAEKPQSPPRKRPSNKYDWYETEIQPVVGTSLFVEVEFSSSESDGEDCSEDPDKLKTEENAFCQLQNLEGQCHENTTKRVTILGKTTFECVLKRRVQKFTKTEIKQVERIPMKNQIKKRIKEKLTEKYH